MSQDKVYDRTLETARASGITHDFNRPALYVNGQATGLPSTNNTHIKGWHKAKLTTIVQLYLDGKITPAQAEQFGARPIDHIKAVESGAVTVEQLVEAGIDLRKLETVRKQFLARHGCKVQDESDFWQYGKQQAKQSYVTLLQATQAHDQAQVAKAQPHVMAVVVKKSGKEMTVNPPVKPLTKQRVESAEAIMRHEQIEANKRKIERLKAEIAKQNRVGIMSPAELADIERRNATKGAKVVVK